MLEEKTLSDKIAEWMDRVRYSNKVKYSDNRVQVTLVSKNRVVSQNLPREDNTLTLLDDEYDYT